MFYIRRDYYCPHCHRWQSFLSILPVLSDRWRCRGCQKTFEIDAVCVGSNWAVVAAVWSMPLSFVAGELLAMAEAIRSVHMQNGPITKDVFIRDILSPIGCGGPILMVIGAFLFLIVGYFAGLVYGRYVTGRM